MNLLEIKNKTEKIADTILKNHFLILVLERFNIGFGLQEKTIEEICEEHNVNIDLFMAISNLHQNTNILPKLNPNKTDILKVVEYLQNSHNYYTTEAIPNISQQIDTFIKNQKEEDLTFILIKRFFSEYRKEVFNHLEYEEKVVYPYIIKLVRDNKLQSGYNINDYKHHHEDIESKLEELKNLLIKHLPEKNDRKFRRTFLFELFRLERDLRIHTIIEENILVPAIEYLENKLKQ
jgi:regulator of cell morphogenesis and NO signaling